LIAVCLVDIWLRGVAHVCAVGVRECES